MAIYGGYNPRATHLVRAIEIYGPLPPCHSIYTSMSPQNYEK